MYEDSWYTYVPPNNDASSNHNKRLRKDSLLKQTNGAILSDDPEPVSKLFNETIGSHSPPRATLLRRAKSYSDFYEAALNFLQKEARPEERSRDDVRISRPSKFVVDEKFEKFEDEILAEANTDYQLYRDQLFLSERHLNNLLDDTTSALDFLTSLSFSFKTVESESTAFQAQCEDLLDEQRRIRELADEIGTELQYYAYLEPLTRRLNAPGAGRLVKGDDFLDMLRNLNTCVNFMDRHPTYRDASTYRTRYLSLLDRALNLVQLAFSSAITDVTSDVTKELRSKNHNETAEYIQLYGKYEAVTANLGPQIERLMKSSEFAYGRKEEEDNSDAYAVRYHELFTQILATYLKNREIVGVIVSKNLKTFATADKASSDFHSFARHCVQYVLDICHNEQNLVAEYFQDGPWLMTYDNLAGWNKNSDYAERLEQSILSHLETLHNFLLPYMMGHDLRRICDLVNWLETTYVESVDEEIAADASRDDRGWIAQALLNRHLWKSLNEEFSKAATEIEHFKPTTDDLKITGKVFVPPNKTGTEADLRGIETEIEGQHTSMISNAYPTVRTAVKLLIMYNDGFSDRPRTGDVLYEIVHQATESLQKAATIIKKSAGLMDAQLFLIKNLMLIENLFMTHEIPDSIRQSAEFDFSPIWNTIGDLQAQKQLFNPLAYITPLVKGNLLPAVVDRLLDARKELERVLVQQITAFTRTWQSRLADKDYGKKMKATEDLEALLKHTFDDETTRSALWRMIRAEE